MTLVRAGKLDLDAPVQQYCAVYPAKTSPEGKPWVITTRELLSHRAGQRWYRDDTELKNTTHYASVADAVFGPAGMTATVPDDPAKIIDHRARPYEKTMQGNLQNAPPFDPSDRLPGGGWLSTSDDLARFAVAVMSGKLVPKADLEEMWKPLTVEDNGSGYGLGWGIGSLDGHRIVGHDGGQVGTSTSLKLVPDSQLAVAIMTNVEGAMLDDLAESILKQYLRASSSSETK